MFVYFYNILGGLFFSTRLLHSYQQGASKTLWQIPLGEFPPRKSPLGEFLKIPPQDWLMLKTLHLVWM